MVPNEIRILKMFSHYDIILTMSMPFPLWKNFYDNKLMVKFFLTITRTKIHIYIFSHLYLGAKYVAKPYYLIIILIFSDLFHWLKKNIYWGLMMLQTHWNVGVLSRISGTALKNRRSDPGLERYALSRISFPIVVDILLMPLSCWWLLHILSMIL